jgi:Domain of unknown function (DUF4271)
MNDGIPKIQINAAEDWMVFVFLFGLIVIAYTRRFYPLRLPRTWGSFLRIRTLRQTMREEPNTFSSNILLNLIFFMMSALVIYLILGASQANLWGVQHFWLYLLLVLAIVITYAIKSASIRIFQWIAGYSALLLEYEYLIFITNRFLGLVLLPMNLLLVYGNSALAQSMLFGCMMVYALIIAMRVVRGGMMAWSGGVPIIYIFFYICTLEILPVALIMTYILGFEQ